jgi:uncharacterized coiled-coil protein SlyX
MASQFSLYIPIISTSYSEDAIKQIFGHNVGNGFGNNVGSVYRVDFAPAKSKPGHNVNGQATIRSAYVYISVFYKSRLSENIQRTVFGLQKGFRFTVAPSEYWVLLKNRNPIPSCDQNIHQLAERLRIVESLASSQRNQIDTLNQMLIEQGKYSERMLDVFVDLLHDMDYDHDMDIVNSKYNYIQFGKPYCKRRLLNHNDDGDTINKTRRNDAEIDDDDYDNSTIDSEIVDKCCEYSSDITFRSIGDDTLSEKRKRA